MIRRTSALGAATGAGTGDGIGRRECQQVALACLVEPQRTSDGGQHVRRGVDAAALLEPRVPGDGHAGEQRDLLATQARRAAAAPGRETDLLGTHGLTPGA